MKHVKPDNPNTINAFSNKIIVIDDDYFFREALVDMLSDYGYTVVSAENGLEGYQKLKLNSDADLVFVDLIMPVMDGFTFIKNARNDFPDIPIVVISGVGTVEKVVEAIRVGAWDFINKPIVSHELLKIVIDRNIDKYITCKSNKEYQHFLENLAKVRSNQLEEALTREKNVEETSRHDISVYKNAFQKIPIPTVLVNDGTRKILDANEAFMRLAGYTSQDLNGLSFADICFATSNGGEPLSSSALLSEESALKARVRFSPKTGKSFDAHLQAIPFLHDEKEQLVMVLLDVVQDKA
jgi:PAS domain S-box-containing protein